MGTWRGTGRRALAVGAGALLIGALGAGPAYAGSDNDDDEYTYVDDSCSDYHFSWYYEHGYDYDEHWDDGDHDRWDKDRWDHGKDWHRGDDWKKHWNESDFYVKDGKVYDKKTNKPVFDLGTGKPIGLPSNDIPVQDTAKAPSASSSDKQTSSEQEATKPEATRPEATKPEATKPEATQPEVKQPEVTEPEAKQPEAKQPEVEQPEVKQPAASTGSDGSSTSIDNKAVVTDLAAGDPWDDKDRDKDWNHDRNRDRDRDWDRDKDDRGWWDGWWEKESHSVDVSCYEDKESNHRWYDDRPVGEIDATEVKTVPKGGVDTGN